MELLDETKLVGWCVTVLGRRSFWLESLSESKWVRSIAFLRIENFVGDTTITEFFQAGCD